jgi:hypothetical protein
MYAIASEFFDLAVAWISYLHGARNVCVVVDHFASYPSPKSRSISSTVSPSVIAVSVVVNGATHVILFMSIYIPKFCSVFSQELPT